jgi:hypothetical protein
MSDIDAYCYYVFKDWSHMNGGWIPAQEGRKDVFPTIIGEIQQYLLICLL